MAGQWNGGRNPINVSLRPLNKGIIKDSPSNLIDDGALLDAGNYIVGRKGPKRRPALTEYFNSATVDYPPVEDIFVLWQTDGSQLTIVLDSKFMYKATVSGLSGVYYTYSTGTVTAYDSTTTVSGSGTSWDGEIFSGDVIIFDPGTSDEEIEISSVVNDSTITLVSAPDTDYSGVSYTIRKAFGTSNVGKVDWTNVDSSIVFADGQRPLMQFDGTTLGAYDTSLSFIPHCVNYHKDRLYCGYPIVSSQYFRNRIVWSTVTDHTDFSMTNQFISLPYVPGYVKRLVSLGTLQVAYFSDSIWIGRMTGIAGNSLPMSFEQLNTGGVSAVGMKAITPWVDGHFFVGQDDIYFIDANFSINPVGSRVVSETIEKCGNLNNVWAVNDPKNNRIVFGFPGETGDNIEKIWSFDWKAKSWSYDIVTGTSLSAASVSLAITWDTVDSVLGAGATWDTDGPTIGTWEASFTDEESNVLLVGFEDGVRGYSDSGSIDPSSANISSVIETKDFDYNAPDKNKTHTRLSIKIDRELASDLIFTVTGSTDRGVNWKDLGTITIEAGEDEGKVDFRLTGSTARFRLTSDSEVNPYIIMEVVLRVFGRGLEVHSGAND